MSGSLPPLLAFVVGLLSGPGREVHGTDEQQAVRGGGEPRGPGHGTDGSFGALFVRREPQTQTQTRTTAAMKRTHSGSEQAKIRSLRATRLPFNGAIDAICDACVCECVCVLLANARLSPRAPPFSLQIFRSPSSRLASRERAAPDVTRRQPCYGYVTHAVVHGIVVRASLDGGPTARMSKVSPEHACARRPVDRTQVVRSMRVRTVLHRTRQWRAASGRRAVVHRNHMCEHALGEQLARLAHTPAESKC